MSQDAVNAWGIEIADECMFALLTAECSMGMEPEGVLGFTDESCAEVRTLGESSAGMKQAFAWLSMRGFVRLGKDEHGEHVVVIAEPKPARGSLTAEAA